MKARRRGQRPNAGFSGIMNLKEGGEGMAEERPALPEIIEERDRITIRFGNSTLTLTAGSLTVEQNRSRPHSESTDDSSR